MKTTMTLLSAIIVLMFFSLNEAQGQWTYNGTDIYNTNSGNVGIGTNIPEFKLDVVRFGNAQVRVCNNGGIAGATFRMTDGLSGADFAFKSTSIGGFKIRDIAHAMDVVYIEGNSAANCIYINSAGNVGIGTSTPTYKLSLEGDFYHQDYYPFIYMNNTQSGGNAGITFRQNGAYRAWLFYDDGESLLRLNAEAGGGGRNDLVILSNGHVCLGTTNDAAGYRLSVYGKVACEEVLVDLIADWPDYVFSEGYNLMSIKDLERSIQENNHLPGIPSSSEVEENGFELGDMQRRLLEKVEELTLYTIEQEKKIERLEQKIAEMEKDR